MSFGRFTEGMGSFFSSMMGGEKKQQEQAPKLIDPTKIKQHAQLYVLQRRLSPDEFLTQLDETRADEYIPLLEEVINDLAQRTEGTRMIFRVNQLESMLEQGLEKRICQAKGIPVIEDIGRRAA